jgi:hypothetical protein
MIHRRRVFKEVEGQERRLKIDENPEKEII